MSLRPPIPLPRQQPNRTGRTRLMKRNHTAVGERRRMRMNSNLLSEQQSSQLKVLLPILQTVKILLSPPMRNYQKKRLKIFWIWILSPYPTGRLMSLADLYMYQQQMKLCPRQILLRIRRQRTRHSPRQRQRRRMYLLLPLLTAPSLLTQPELHLIQSLPAMTSNQNGYSMREASTLSIAGRGRLIPLPDLQFLKTPSPKEVKRRELEVRKGIIVRWRKS
mmetsp:Transcript_3814/g.8324  ORF Transcript_3814/g.8324 Transcript_3814/m.8324 type:complete len:220 (+) Transcript_3814:529-1188(+)